MDWALVDESYTKYGLLKILREGNGYVWKVFGVDNFERPLFIGKEGQFEDARRAAEAKLGKDLKQIFWILSQMSEKERHEGEPADAELIEQAIRQINGGDKKRAIYFIDQAIHAEGREKEPEDVKQLQLARTMLLAEKSVEKKWHMTCPACGKPVVRPSGSSRANCSTCGWRGMPYEYDDEKSVGDDTPEVESEVNYETEHLQKFPSEPAQAGIERPEMKSGSKKLRLVRALGKGKASSFAPPGSCPRCGTGREKMETVDSPKGEVTACPTCHWRSDRTSKKSGERPQAYVDEEAWRELRRLGTVREQNTEKRPVITVGKKKRVKGLRVVRALAK